MVLFPDVSVIDELFKTAKQGPVGRRAAGVELPLIQAGEEEEEDMKIAFQHASGESVRSVLVLFIFGAADGGMSFFEMHLMGEGEKQMARLYLMADKVYPVPVGTFLNQEVYIVDGLSVN